MIIEPDKTEVPDLHAYLLGAVAPRPIAFVSTIDSQGRVNLSPFSFFNVFSANPPVLIFSPARRGRENTLKDTYENVLEVPEAVVNVVTYNMVHQASLASAEYPRGVNEFERAGFTPTPSRLVRPPRVAESPVSMECRVNQVIPLGDGGGAGNLVICQVLLMHINDAVLDDKGRIDPKKVDAVARMGGDWYCRAQGDALFQLPQPGKKLGIGFQALPAEIRNSPVLSSRHLAMLAGVTDIPEIARSGRPSAKPEDHYAARDWLEKGDAEKAWEVLMSAG